MLAQTKLRIGARRNLDKVDLETVYGEIVRVVGGTRYVNGVANGPNQGLLDYRNFSIDAGIPNSMKGMPRSSWQAAVKTSLYTSPSGNIYAPLPPDFVEGSVTAWGLYAASVSNAVNTGSFVLSYLRGGTTTQIGTSGTVTNINPDINAGTGAIVAHTLITGPSLKPGDFLGLAITFNVNVTDLVAYVYINSKHQK